jgi:hypothetical protein
MFDLDIVPVNTVDSFYDRVVVVYRPHRGKTRIGMGRWNVTDVGRIPLF